MTKQLADYELEKWLRSLKLDSSGPAGACGQTYNQTYSQSYGPTGSGSCISWQQRVQYAVGHAINDYFTLLPAVRLHTPIQVLLNRRWPRNQRDFPDPLFYWQVYHRMVSELTFITGTRIYEYPLALYENWGTHVAGLDLHLSIIFQAVWQERGNPDWVTVQKFLVEENESITQAFVHLVNVFWHSAFGRPPGDIEVYALMEGRRQVIPGESLDLQESLDYVWLLQEAWECGCCHRESEEPGADINRTGGGEPWRLGVS
ncbi:hypothetical protein U9M73_21705 [Paenibacillus phoenicis]|uniref:Uncharacterized protein n=1 Tax=Paenibacillus phoenicis TaxID=554117 RepID=A0ABU5PRU9_9BACL|nr:hypothetical protein [Paenibacillus phoenicis]MEA3572547.1 hypothetical protein [Paenibacillus phoenicis]